MTAIQLTLPIPAPNMPALNLTGAVYSVMASGAWLTPSEIQRAVNSRTGEWHSDSSLTARIRELRRPEFGGHSIEKRKREGSRAYEYRLEAL